jgi:hypothetical protein
MFILSINLNYSIILARREEVSESLACKHLLKFVCKNSKGELYYPFASHPRFKFWFYDRIRRHRSLDQCKVYLKQNPSDANLSISELKSIIQSGNSMQLLQRMSAYSSNVTGCDSYWHKRRCELEATFEQKAPATVFFTFSYADNHWLDLHRLMPRYYQSNDDTVKDNHKYQDVIANPHLVDWYFSYRLNAFLECVFDNILDCEWRWHRFEWQSRTAIHAHGAARFSNDPGLIELTKVVYNSRLHIRRAVGKVFTNIEEIEQFEKKVDNGIQAEKLILSYVDTLITAMNTRIDNGGLQIGVPDPHPCGLRTTDIEDSKLDNDYLDICNCCQRHVCRLEGYCKSKKCDNKCRFGYPFQIEPVSRIEFTETENSVRATVLCMRNDPFMNVHNRVICHTWRGNVDMQIILDHHAAVNYMVKYATKSEKAGTNYTQVMKDVIGRATEEENPQTKIRSIMLKSIAGKRDLGQCEVSRLLLSEPMYHSTFNYVNLSTDLFTKEVNINANANEDDDATKKNIIDFYADRFNNQRLQNALDDINNLMEFTRKFIVKKGELALRENPEKVVVIPFPKVYFFKLILVKFIIVFNLK